MVGGYKCFDKGLINRYGKKFEIGKIYHVVGIVKFLHPYQYSNLLKMKYKWFMKKAKKIVVLKK